MKANPAFAERQWTCFMRECAHEQKDAKVLELQYRSRP